MRGRHAATLALAIYLTGFAVSYGWIVHHEPTVTESPVPEYGAVIFASVWPVYWPLKASAVAWRPDPHQQAGER